MAKKREVNKSEAIRQCLGGHPSFGAKQVVEKLKADGIEVSENLVYGQMRKMKEESAPSAFARSLKEPMATPTTSSATAAPTTSSATDMASMIGFVEEFAKRFSMTDEEAYQTLKEIAKEQG